jgi:hypothetical protein
MTGCSIVRVEPHHNPDEGRNIINDNFACVEATITDIQVNASTGSTIVSAGTNVNVELSFTGAVPIYQVSVVSSAVTYTNSAATTSTLGGIAAGSTFSAKTIQEMFDDLLYPYQTPAFTSFSRTNLSSTYELGQTVLIGSQTFTWTTSNSTNVSANTISIVQNFSPTTTVLSGSANDGTQNLTLANSYSAGSLTTTTLYTISAKNSLGSTFTSTISRTWYPRWYYGKFSGTSINASELVALPSNALASSVVGTYYSIPSSVSAEYVYFAIPNTLAQPSDFRDSTGGCFGTNFPYSVQGSVVVTNAYGVNITYTVYRFTNPTLGALTAWLCP